jgi:CheY-like chemotaxis protein/HPt (histidine-containing phosphotransfer) domain-containing protein
MRASPRFTHQSHDESGGGRVLVADDNDITRTVAVALLAQRRLQAAIANDGLEAVAMARRDDYDAIFMDCMMPRVDGFQATRQIRSAEVGRHVPIIALTVLTMPGDRERCLAAGMDDYLAKPLLIVALDAALERWLPLTPALEPPTAQDELVDEAVLQLRDALPPALRVELVVLFEAQSEECVEEITDASERGDREGVRRAAHLLKGSSATLGAIKLQACCQELERMSRSTDGDTNEKLDRLRVVAAEASLALRRQLLGGGDGAGTPPLARPATVGDDPIRCWRQLDNEVMP